MAEMIPYNDEEFKELLRKALRERLQEMDFPPRLPVEEGKEYLVKIVGTMDNPWRKDGPKMWIVQWLEDGGIYRLPVSALLHKGLEGAEPGDYALIKYRGMVTLRDGRRVHRFSVAVMKAAEAEMLIKRASQSKAIKQEQKEVPKAEFRKASDILADEIRDIVSKLLDVYGSLTLDEVKYYVNEVKKIPVDITPELLQQLGFKVVSGEVRRGE